MVSFFEFVISHMWLFEKVHTIFIYIRPINIYKGKCYNAIIKVFIDKLKERN